MGSEDISYSQLVFLMRYFCMNRQKSELNVVTRDRYTAYEPKTRETGNQTDLIVLPLLLRIYELVKACIVRLIQVYIDTSVPSHTYYIPTKENQSTVTDYIQIYGTGYCGALRLVRCLCRYFSSELVLDTSK